jgi:hypothetical protein
MTLLVSVGSPLKKYGAKPASHHLTPTLSWEEREQEGFLLPGNGARGFPLLPGEGEGEVMR